MKRTSMLRAILGGAALLLGLAQARADYPVSASTAASNAQITMCGFSVSAVNIPCHAFVNSAKQELFTLTTPGMVGLAFGGSALTLGQKAKAGSLPVALPTDPDILNAAATITAADGASTTAAGQNSVSIVTGTPTAGSTYSYAVNGQSEADFTIGNVFVGTLQFEGSANGGTTWTPRSAHVMGTKYRQIQVTGPGVFHINAAGLTNVRVRAIALTSGTPSVQLNTTAGTGSLYVMNALELADNATGLSASIKAGGSAGLTDAALTVQNPNEAAALALLNAAIGDCTSAAYTGTGIPSLCSVLKASYNQLVTVVGQAAPTSVVGTSIGSSTQVPGFQGVTGGVPVTVAGTVTTVSVNALASPAFRIPVAAAGTNATTFFIGTKKAFHVRFCNTSTSFRSLKLYDKASAPTVGTDVPVATIPAPAGACPVIDWTAGFPFSLGVAVAITGGAADADTTAIAAGDIVGLNIDHN